MNLEELFDYKNQLISDLLTNESIVKLIDENTSLDRSLNLVYTQVFPYEYVPETVEKGKTYICCDVDIQKALNKTLLLPTIYVWVFTHKDKLRLPKGGVRTDKLCSEICKTINGSFKYGLGELEIQSVKRFAPMTDYQGKVMTFYTKEVSQYFDPKKEIPTNRKKK